MDLVKVNQEKALNDTYVNVQIHTAEKRKMLSGRIYCIGT